MRTDDIEAVVAIEQAVFPDPWPRGFFIAPVRSELLLRAVAEEEGRVVGYVFVWGGEPGHVANLAVAPGSRRQGIGSLLLNRAEEFVLTTGAARIVLEVRESNAVARAFYGSRGYATVGTQPGYYKNGEDAIVMAKSLVSD